MLSKSMLEQLNQQVNAEMSAAYSYLSMAAYLESHPMPGAAHWMKEQAKEELEHAMRHYTFIYRRGGNVALKDVAAPKSSWTKPIEVFEEALQQEQRVTKNIHELVALATQEKDYATQEFLQWFVREQVEEEDSIRNIIDSFKLTGGSPSGLFLIDKELGARAAAASGAAGPA